MENKSIETIRNEYLSGALTRKDLLADPISQFEIWLDQAIKSGVEEPTAMVLSTIDTDNFPQSRVVLLKSVNNKGFTFFTNYNSNKGQTIQNNNKVSLLFFWPQLQRQVRISGITLKVSGKISDHYFFSRPTDSQVAAIISNQSSTINSRKILEEKFNRFKHNNLPIKRPQWWGGYVVQPFKFEFWQGRENRLHDRFVYAKKKDSWHISRLEP